MYHRDPSEIVAQCCMLVAFVIWVIAAMKALLTGDSSAWGITVNHRVTPPPTPTRRARRPAPRPRPAPGRAQPMPASSLLEDDRLLAGAAKRMGIPEGTLRQWLAEGRFTIQDRPADRVQ